MPRFFAEVTGKKAVLQGEDALHIAKSLRMKVGESVTLCDGKGRDFFCRIQEITRETVTVAVENVLPSQGEASLHTHLFMAMPKADKFEMILQKSIELGVSEITPMVTEFCVAARRLEDIEKKLPRYRKIAEAAAKQAGRGRIPEVHFPCTFVQAVQKAQEYDRALFFYEGGGQPFSRIAVEKLRSAALLIGAEGGFSEKEVALCDQKQFPRISLGSRILRCETAPLCVLSLLMYRTGNLE